MNENVSEINQDFQNLAVTGKSKKALESEENSFQKSEKLKSSPTIKKNTSTRKSTNDSELNKVESERVENGTVECSLKTENDIIKQPYICKKFLQKQCDKNNQKTRNSCTKCIKQACTEKFINNNLLEVNINSLGATAACITPAHDEMSKNDQLTNPHDNSRVIQQSVSESKIILSSSTSKSSNENLDQRGEHLRKLKSWINQRMTIEMTDGRVLVGMFLCTDRDANVILGSCAEYSPHATYLPHRSDDDCPYQEPRLLGLVMVPGHHIVRILHDPPQIT